MTERGRLLNIRTPPPPLGGGEQVTVTGATAQPKCFVSEFRLHSERVKISQTDVKGAMWKCYASEPVQTPMKVNEDRDIHAAVTHHICRTAQNVTF